MDMKIVVLDGCAANSGDISWDSIGKYGELTVYDRTDRSEVVSRIGDAEIITTNKTVIDRAVIEACPNLRYIGVLATGYNVARHSGYKCSGIQYGCCGAVYICTASGTGKQGRGA